MKHARFLIALLAATGLNAQSPATTTVVEHVSVVPMDHDRILHDQTVVVRQNRIVSVTPAEDPAADEATIGEIGDATRIDGSGRFLIPGLHDMHLHVEGTAELTLCIAHGVTTVRNLWGGPDTLALRGRVHRGELLGPTIWTTGGIVDGPDPVWPGSRVVATADDARQVVAEHELHGYDALKVYDRLRPEAYHALIERSAEAGLPVVGHVPVAVGLATALRSRQRSIEHLRGYWPIPAGTDVDELAELTATAGTWNCPTLVVHDLPFAALEDLTAARARPEVQLVPPAIRARWHPERDARFGGHTEMTPELRRAHQRRMDQVRQLVRALHDAGAPLLVGTDAPNPFVVPGFAVHQELEQLVAAGLSEFDALAAATSRASEFLGRADTGTVAAGQVADLVLLDHNPLEDIAATRAIAGVFVRGEWIDADRLERILADLVASYREPSDWFAGEAALPGEPILTYRITWNHTPIGAMRCSIADGARHSLAILREPNGFATKRGVREPDGSLRIEFARGDRESEVRLTTDGDAVRGQGRADTTGIDVEVAHPDGAQLGSDLLPHLLDLTDALTTIAPGESGAFVLQTPEFDETFAISTTRLSARRLDDDGSLRQFALQLETSGFVTPARLSLDAHGIPVTLTLEFPLGQKVFQRVD